MYIHLTTCQCSIIQLHTHSSCCQIRTRMSCWAAAEAPFLGDNQPGRLAPHQSLSRRPVETTGPCQGDGGPRTPTRPALSSISPGRPQGCRDVWARGDRADCHHRARGEVLRRAETQVDHHYRCCKSEEVLEKRDRRESGRQQRQRQRKIWKSHVVEEEEGRSCPGSTIEGGAGCEHFRMMGRGREERRRGRGREG